MSLKTMPQLPARLCRANLDGVPLIVPVIMTAIVLVAGVFHSIPKNMIGGLAVITGLGMLLGPLGNRIPVINKIGSPLLRGEPRGPLQLASTKPDRPKVRDPIGSELHQVTDLVRSFTGGFTEQSMKATPAVRTPRGLPPARRRPTAHQPMNTHLRPHPRMRPDHNSYEDCRQPRTPLDGDWFT